MVCGEGWRLEARLRKLSACLRRSRELGAREGFGSRSERRAGPVMPEGHGKEFGFCSKCSGIKGMYEPLGGEGTWEKE